MWIKNAEYFADSAVQFILMSSNEHLSFYVDVI